MIIVPIVNCQLSHAHAGQGDGRFELEFTHTHSTPTVNAPSRQSKWPMLSLSLPLSLPLDFSRDQSWRVRMLYAGAVVPSLFPRSPPPPMLLCVSVWYAPGPGPAAGAATWLEKVAKPLRASRPCSGGVRPCRSMRILDCSMWRLPTSSARSFVRFRWTSFCAARTLSSSA
jgi:hypothetical protein